jgi:resuscitation-promoting factor RpfA
MARYRGRHRVPQRFDMSATGRTLARTAIAGAVLTVPTVVAPAAHADASSTWDRLAQCESGGNWAINTGNGFSGGLQFTPSTWRGFGGGGVAHHASREEQIAVAERVLAKQGWGAWPACSRKLGLRGKPAKVTTAPQATPSSAGKVTASTSGRSVTVGSGDTLSRIAAANGVDGGWQALVDANPGMGNPDRISVGDVVKLP